MSGQSGGGAGALKSSTVNGAGVRALVQGGERRIVELGSMSGLSESDEGATAARVPTISGSSAMGLKSSIPG